MEIKNVKKRRSTGIATFLGVFVGFWRVEIEICGLDYDFRLYMIKREGFEGIL